MMLKHNETEKEMYEPYNKETACTEDRIAWALCQIIDDDAPMRWTRYRGVSGCIALNPEVMADLLELQKAAANGNGLRSKYGRILTCVYCGHEYHQDTPAAGSDVLTQHIKVCEHHPMRKAEADIAMLRAALVGLIGVDGDEQELRNMEVAMRTLPAPDYDKAVSINAIHALLATMTPNA